MLSSERGEAAPVSQRATVHSPLATTSSDSAPAHPLRKQSNYHHQQQQHNPQQHVLPATVDGLTPYLHCPRPSPCQDSLKLEWAFGVHKDYKSVIHNLSVASSAPGGAGGGNSAANSYSSTRGSVSGQSARGGKSRVSTAGAAASVTGAGTQHPAGSSWATSTFAAAPTARKVFYPLAHVGVIYDGIANTQRHLVGHAYTIVATCVSHSRRFVVTADEGDRALWGRRTRRTHAAVGGGFPATAEEDYLATAAEQEARMTVDGHAACDEAEDDGSLMIVWDTHTGLPVTTIPVGKYGGVVCCAMSLDGLYIATINRRSPQEIMIWGWTAESSGFETDPAAMTRTIAGVADIVPEYVRRIPAQDEQTSIRFSASDPQLLCTNGLHRVLFWSWSEGMLKYYSPPILQREARTPVGSLTQTVLIPGTTMACSGTVDGDVVLWALHPRDRVMKEQDKTLLKVVRVHSGGVTFLTTESGYIVTGGMDGHVRFLDTQLRLVAWFEDLNGGPIVSISFDRPTASAEEALAEAQARTHHNALLEGTTAASHFTSPDFMVSTANAMIVDVPSKAFHAGNRELLRGRLIVQGQDQAIQCVATHPRLSRLAVAGLSGNLHLWDYEQKRVLMLSLFRQLLVQSMAFDPAGTFLAVGFTNGALKILDAETLEERAGFAPKQPDPITRLSFSPDGRMLATGTASGRVGLYEFMHHPKDPSRPLEWDCVGHHKTHRAPISGLQFDQSAQDGAMRLLSVGEDKRLIEYHLEDSDPEHGLLVRTAHKITQGAIPTGFLWAKEATVLSAESQPRGLLDMDDIAFVAEDVVMMDAGPDVMRDASGFQGGLSSTSDFLLIATNEHKISLYLSDVTRQCVKTVLAPTFGGPITDMAIVPARPPRRRPATAADDDDGGEEEDEADTHGGNQKKCLVYATKEKVIGLVELPLRGDPCASMGLLAHPGPIACMAVSHDGAYVFTVGGEDQSMLQWRVNGSAILPPEAQRAAKEARGGVPLDHLLAAVEGGADGELMREVVDYFYYAQIRAQGEETTAKRELLGAIRFSQLPNLLRALGYYPSELEMGHLTYEVANEYGPKGEALAEVDVDTILLDFAQFMRLYVNYRPVFGITRHDIEAAFTAVGANPVSGEISRDTFFKLLAEKGEALSAEEINAALSSLLGDGVRVNMLEDVITARAFAENLLGFEDYDGDTKAAADDEDGDEESEVLDYNGEW